MIYVFEIPVEAVMWRYRYHEKDVPTQQQQAKKDARFQGADIEQGWPAGAQAPALQRAKKADSEWIRRPPRNSLT